MNTKLNIQELFFQLKNKKHNQTRGFDRALFSLGIHHELKTVLIPVVNRNDKNELKVQK